MSILPRTVRLDFSNEFVAGRGQTVNVLAPASVGDARVYTKAQRDAREAIQFDELEQTWFPVTLEDQIYKAIRVPDDFNTFTLKDANAQVYIPMAKSVVDGLAAPLVTQMSAIANDADTPIEDVAADGGNILKVLIQANQVLNQRKIPREGRTLAVGTEVEAAILGLPQLQKVNESGDSGDLLRNASIGRLFGFNIIVAPELPSNFAVAYHKDAFAFITRPSRQPEGAAWSAVASQDGFALRLLRHYNPLQLEDQVVMDTFYGAATLDANRAVSFTVAAGA
nr:P22 phage major capsid protein family protein [Brachybacterium muris]